MLRWPSHAAAAPPPRTGQAVDPCARRGDARERASEGHLPSQNHDYNPSITRLVNGGPRSIVCACFAALKPCVAWARGAWGVNSSATKCVPARGSFPASHWPCRCRAQTRCACCHPAVSTPSAHVHDQRTSTQAAHKPAHDQRTASARSRATKLASASALADSMHARSVVPPATPWAHSPAVASSSHVVVTRHVRVVDRLVPSLPLAPTATHAHAATAAARMHAVRLALGRGGRVVIVRLCVLAHAPRTGVSMGRGSGGFGSSTAQVRQALGTNSAESYCAARAVAPDNSPQARFDLSIPFNN